MMNPRSPFEIENSRSRGIRSLFDLSGQVAVITGGAGLLGARHAEAVAETGGVPVIIDLDGERAEEQAARIARAYGVRATSIAADITDPTAVSSALSQTVSTCGGIDILINNAACNPKVEQTNGRLAHWSRLEHFPLDAWTQDIAVGLTGAMLCSKVFGGEMARRGKGVILNIASDLGVIAPDQRIYRQPDLPDHQQPVKPVSYSVVKHGLIGLTRYLSTYWADRGVRVNSLSPGGVYAGQDPAFVSRLEKLIPMGRMAHQDEYKAAVVFLVSNASSYMTGANVNIDGGRTAW